jgi:hypothetical protein
MPLLFAVTLAAAATVQPTCSWDRPGHNPYTGNAAAAIEHYADIPEAVRAALKRRVADGKPDDQVRITRDAIAGQHQYDPAIRDMHFGRASLCNTVTRDKWAADRVEPGAVYCAEGHCILVPRICGNVSRIARPAAAVAAIDASLHDPELADAVAFHDTTLVDADPRFESESALPPDMDAILTEGQREMMRSARALRELSLSEARAEAALRLASADFDPDDMEARRRLASLNGLGNTPLGDDGSTPSAVPEADGWAMMLGGLGLVGWVARRRAGKNPAAG